MKRDSLICILISIFTLTLMFCCNRISTADSYFMTGAGLTNRTTVYASPGWVKGVVVGSSATATIVRIFDSNTEKARINVSTNQPGHFSFDNLGSEWIYCGTNIGLFVYSDQATATNSVESDVTATIFYKKK